MKKRVRMVEVARRAGVSQATVSLILNNIAGVRIADATRQRVIDTAREIGYSPGPSLNDLQQKFAPIVGVLINEISANYPIDLIDGLQLTARAAGTQLAIFVTDGVTEREAEALATLARLGAEAVVYVNTFHTIVYPDAALDQFRHVLVNCFREDHQGVAVVAAERAAGFTAARHLLECGCQRIATITGDEWHTSVRNLLVGFRRGLKAAGIGLEPDRLRFGNWSHVSGYAAMRDLLALPQLPDGVFCHNDLLARGALVAMAEAGLSAPRDIAVMGIDDREFASHLGLTTMVRPFSAMSQRAMAILQRLQDLPASATIKVGFPLIVRQTSRRIDAPVSAAGPDE